MTNCTGWRAAASARGAGGRGSANAGRVDPFGLEMLIVLFGLAGGLVVAVRLGFCSCQHVCTCAGGVDGLTRLLVLLADANDLVNVVFVQSSLHDNEVLLLYVSLDACVRASIESHLLLEWIAQVDDGLRTYQPLGHASLSLLANLWRAGTAVSTVFAVLAVPTDLSDTAPAAAATATARAASRSSAALGSRATGIASGPAPVSTSSVDALLAHDFDIAVRILRRVVSASHIFIFLLVPATRRSA
jgi:hypothetical protein